MQCWIKSVLFITKDGYIKKPSNHLYLYKMQTFLSYQDNAYAYIKTFTVVFLFV